MKSSFVKHDLQTWHLHYKVHLYYKVISFPARCFSQFGKELFKGTPFIHKIMQSENSGQSVQFQLVFLCYMHHIASNTSMLLLLQIQ